MGGARLPFQRIVRKRLTGWDTLATAHFYLCHIGHSAASIKSKVAVFGPKGCLAA
jgi:hypothetical protein